MFLMDIQPAQRDGVTALVDRENGDDGRAEADSRPARAHRRRARPRGQSRELRGRARPGRPVARVHDHLSVRTSRPTRSWSTAHGGTKGRPATCRRSRSRKACARDSRFSSATRCASTCSAASSPRASTSFREVDFRDFRAGGFMIVFRPGPFDTAPHTLHRGGARREGSGGARAHAGPARRQLSERLGHRSSRGARHRRRHRQQRHARGDRRRRPRAVQRQPDSHRRGLDDEVPARLRGRDPEDARRQQPSDCDDAARRIRRARRHCRHRRCARGDRAELGGRALRAGSAVGALRRRSLSAASSSPRSSSPPSACWPASTCFATSRSPRSVRSSVRRARRSLPPAKLRGAWCTITAWPRRECRPGGSKEWTWRSTGMR